MNKILKIGGILIAGMVGIFVLAVIVLKLISDDQYKQWITTAVQDATGRDLSIDSLELDFNPTLTARARGVSLANAEWSEKPDMLTLEVMEVEVRLLSLLRGEAQIRGLLDQAYVASETSDDGTSNWTMGNDQASPAPEPQDEAEETGGLPLDIVIQELRIEDSRFSFTQGEEKTVRTGHIENLLIETAESGTTLELKANMESVPIQLTGTLGQLTQVLDKASSPIDLNLKVNNNTASISGDWGPLLPEMNMALALQGHIDSPTPLAEIFGFDIIDFGNLNVQAELTAVDGTFAIVDILTNLDGELANAQIEGTIGKLASLEDLELKTELKVDVLQRIFETIGLNLPVELPPQVDVMGVIHSGTNGLAIKDFEAQVRDEGIVIDITGTVDDAMALQGLNGVINARIDSTANLSRYAGLDLPDLGALDITGEVHSQDAVLSLENVDAGLESENITLNITGAMADVKAASGIEADVSLNISSLTEQNLAEIEHMLGQLDIEIPMYMLPQAAKLDSRLTGGVGTLAMTGIQAEVLDAGVTVNLDGEIGNLITPTGVDIGINARADSLSALSKYAGVDLPDKAVLEVSGRLASSAETYALSDVSASLAGENISLGLAGGVSDLLALGGINAELDASINSLSSLSEFIPAKLPHTDPVTVNVSLTQGDSNEIKSAAISVTAESTGTKAGVSANLGDLFSASNLQAVIDIEADSLSSFNQFAGTNLPEKGPLKLTGTAKADGSEYTLEDFNLNLDDQSARGRLGVVLPQEDGGNTLLNGDLQIQYLDLTPFILGDGSGESESTGQQDGSGQDTTEPAPTADEPDRLFSSEPLPLEQLRLIDADFSINAEKLKVNKATATDVEINLALHDGKLQIDPIKAVAGSGSMNGNLLLDGSKDSALLDIDLVVEAFPLATLEGAYDLNLNVDGRGVSAADMMGSLNGQVIAVVRDAKVEKSFATQFGSGLFSFSGDQDYTTVECGILRMDIEDGLVDFDDKLAVQLSEVTWHGGGDIDLKTEKIGVGITPKARKGIGIGAGSLVNLFYLGGTLKNPSPQINPADVAVKYGKYMAYVSTGGLSLLAEVVINKFKGNEDLCAQILNGTVFDKDGGDETAAASESGGQAGLASVDSETASQQAREQKKPKRTGHQNRSQRD